jgi:hypothetical protein
VEAAAEAAKNATHKMEMIPGLNVKDKIQVSIYASFLVFREGILIEGGRKQQDKKLQTFRSRGV